MPELTRRRYREQTGAIVFETSKRNFLIILVAVLIGVGVTVELTYYVAQWYFAAQHADDPGVRKRVDMARHSNSGGAGWFPEINHTEPWRAAFLAARRTVTAR
jgi:hypothetical protein